MPTSRDNAGTAVPGDALPRHRFLAAAAEASIPVAAIAFAVLFLATVSSLPEAAQRFPVAAGATIIALGVATVASIAIAAIRGKAPARDANEPEEDTPARGRRLAFWSFWAVLAVWPLLVIEVGFYSSAAIGTIVLSVAAREWNGRPTRRELAIRLLWGVLLAAIVVTVVYLVAGVALGIRFPQGILI